MSWCVEAALGFRSLWRNVQRGLRASPFSEGLRAGAGVARFYLRHSSAKKGGPPRRDSTYVARRGFCVFLGAVHARVRVRTCATHTCVVHNGDSTSSHGLLNKPRKSRDVSPARQRQRSGELSPNPTLSLYLSLLSHSRFFLFFFSLLFLPSLLSPVPVPSSSINHPFSILPATFFLWSPNIARADQRLDLIWLVLHWELKGCTYARFVSVNSRRSSRWR